jgi:hypothetical protein
VNNAFHRALYDVIRRERNAFHRALYDVMAILSEVQCLSSGFVRCDLPGHGAFAVRRLNVMPSIGLCTM